MERDDAALVRHMLDTARSIARRTESVARDEFDADDDLRDALALRVQIVGEAASKVSHAYRTEHPEVPWGRIVGMRHRIVHDYLNVDFDILWQVAKKDVPALVPLLEGLAKSE
ncbi:MAG: DUF86 domain-containing protein [Candidatus Hydrogenedentes bacterium]|nr:DUF86 domain-containing protein [Candidatus Hydrogenedentota bacterium]